MNAVLRAVAASGAPSVSAAGHVVRGYDRPVELTDAEARALAELGATGLRRGRAGRAASGEAQWAALARLVEPLDAARAVLHHDDVAANRRASRAAAGLILVHCGQVNRPYWSWTGWEWARLAGASAAEFRAAQTVPTETAVRPFLLAGLAAR